ncbi:MAG: exonuclease domain-containing protein [Cyclobacteriaceae bacterium]|jgi:DNA polymerase-3 subunit epsilon
MNLTLKIPLCVFDLETTGTNVTQDRILELALIKVMPSGEEVRKHYLVNPERPIPQESTAIHGITDQDVSGKPAFREIARELARFLEGADLAGFNIVKFDLPMLVEEFLRAGVDFDYSRKRIVDAQRIFHLMEKRTLSAAYRFYCQQELTNSHTAEADTQATLDVLRAQIARYENQDVTDGLGKKIGVIKNNTEDLARLTMQDVVDLAGRMIRTESGDVVFNFGKHKNKTVLQVLKDEPSYYDWMMNGDFPLDTKRKLTELKLSTLKK